MKRLLRLFCLWFPVITTRDRLNRQWHKLNTEHNAFRQQERHQHARDLTRAKDKAAGITTLAGRAIDQCHNIQFDRRHADQYAVQVTFDARMMGGFCERDSLEFLARHIGMQVEAEIASSRFVQSARDLEVERHNRERRRFTVYPPS